MPVSSHDVKAIQHLPRIISILNGLDIQQFLSKMGFYILKYNSTWKEPLLKVNKNLSNTII